MELTMKYILTLIMLIALCSCNNQFSIKKFNAGIPPYAKSISPDGNSIAYIYEVKNIIKGSILEEMINKKVHSYE